MRRNVGITVSALILAAQLGTPLAAAEPSLEQLSTISGFLTNNDVRGLRSYLTEHPELLDEDTDLAALLHDFMRESANTNSFLGFKPALGGAVSGLYHGPPGDDDNIVSTPAPY